MKHSIRDFIIGLTAIAGLTGIALLLVLFGEIRAGAMARYKVSIQLNDASGITGASSVTLNGVSIGSITDLRPADDPRQGVVLDLAIDEDIEIPRDIEVLLERGLVGEATLSLRANPLEPGIDDPGVLQPGETLATESINLLDEIGTQVSAALDERLGGLSDSMRSFRELTHSLTRVADQALDLVEPRTIEDVEQGRASPNLPTTMARLDIALASAQGWLGDEELGEEVRAASRRLVDLLDELESVVGEWTSAAQTLAEQSEKVGTEATVALTEVGQMSRALSDVLEDVRVITSAVNEGKGTAGMLVHNPDLYRSLNDAAVRLEKALVEAQLLIEKYRKEGVPIQF